MAKGVDGGRAEMTEMVMPEGGGDGEAGTWSGRCSLDGVKVANTIAAKHHTSGQISLIEKPRASNWMEQLLSRVH